MYAGAPLAWVEAGPEHWSRGRAGSNSLNGSQAVRDGVWVAGALGSRGAALVGADARAERSLRARVGHRGQGRLTHSLVQPA